MLAIAPLNLDSGGPMPGPDSGAAGRAGSGQGVYAAAAAAVLTVCRSVRLSVQRLTDTTVAFVIMSWQYVRLYERAA